MATIVTQMQLAAAPCLQKSFPAAAAGFGSKNKLRFGNSRKGFVTRAETRITPGELASNAASVSGSAMLDFADLQERRFKDDLMIILDRDGFPAEIRPKITELCGPVFRRYAAAYKGTVPAEPFVEMRRALEKAEIERFKDILCAAIGWARWNMAKDFRAWYATLK